MIFAAINILYALADYELSWYNLAMKKYLLNVTFLSIIAFFSFAVIVFATVGGPTFIGTLTYNSADESVYYIIQDNSGRGCPPELMKISLNTGKEEIVYSCEDGEKLLQKNNYDTSVVNAEINKIIKDYKPLSQISLKDNRISIDVNFLNSKNFPIDAIDEIRLSNFTATVYQDNVKVIDLPVVGCNKEQPFLFAGYSIPGFDKKIVLLLSSLGNCLEGGYTNETLYVIGGVSNLDKTFYFNSIKDFSALIPSSATLLVYEPEKLENVTENIQDQEIQDDKIENIEEGNNASKYNIPIYIIVIISVLSIVFGLFLGKLLDKNN